MLKFFQRHHLMLKMRKLLERLSLSFPLGRRRLFFIYTHRNVNDRFASGLTANTEISYWSQKALHRAFPNVHFLRLQKEKDWRINQIRKRDIVIGHIGETYERASLKTPHLIAFYPWCGHQDRITAGKVNCSDLQKELSQLKKARSIIFLTSEYNVQKYIKKETNFWKGFCDSHPVRWVHQPIDLSLFERIKFDYQSDHFLYVGNDNHMKCVKEAKQLVKTLGKRLSLFGMEGRFLNNLDTQTVRSLPKMADFFIQAGMWEAQCVSILEAAARGFIPIVSKETGYPYDHPYLLKHGDHTYNLETLKKLLSTSSEERKELGDHLYTSLKNDPLHNTWEALTSILVEEVEKSLTS